MAEYWTRTSIKVAMTQEQADWLQRLHDAVEHFSSDVDPDIKDARDELDGMDFSSFGIDDMQFEPKAGPIEAGLLIYGDQINPEYLANLLQHFLRKFDLDEPVTFAYSWGCSKMRPNEFGGGACIITKREILYTDTTQWMNQTVNALRSPLPSVAKLIIVAERAIATALKVGRWSETGGMMEARVRVDHEAAMAEWGYTKSLMNS